MAFLLVPIMPYFLKDAKEEEEEEQKRNRKKKSASVHAQNTVYNQDLQCVHFVSIFSV